MGTLATNHQTLVDLAKQEANGTIVADMAEIMSESTAMLADAHVMECNDGSSHKSSIRHGLPKGTFRKLYGYVPSEKSSVEQVVDTTGMLEAYSTPDVDLINKSKNPAQARLNESVAFLEGMGQTAQETMIYGSKVDNEAAFDGLAIRYGKLSTDKKSIGFNIVDAGGQGDDNASIYFITWGERDTALLYPKGSKAGLQHSNDGIQTETNANGEKRKVYQDHFKHDLGLTVKDFRTTCRIANIDVSAAIAGTVDLIALLRKGYFKINKFINKPGQKTFVYMNSTMAEILDAKAADKTNVHLGIKEYCGTDITHYRNLPVRVIDALLETESRVV